MLVLSRKPGERILIDGNIELQVVGIEGGRVRLGISCPRHIRILRSEVPPHNPEPMPQAAPSAGGLQAFPS